MGWPRLESASVGTSLTRRGICEMTSGTSAVLYAKACVDTDAALRRSERTDADVGRRLRRLQPKEEDRLCRTAITTSVESKSRQSKKRCLRNTHVPHHMPRSD